MSQRIQFKEGDEVIIRLSSWIKIVWREAYLWGEVITIKSKSQRGNLKSEVKDKVQSQVLALIPISLYTKKDRARV